MAGACAAVSKVHVELRTSAQRTHASGITPTAVVYIASDSVACGGSGALSLFGKTVLGHNDACLSPASELII